VDYRAENMVRFREQVVPPVVEAGRMLVVNIDGKGIRMLAKELARAGTRGKNGDPKTRESTVGVIYEVEPHHRPIEAILGLNPQSLERERPLTYNKSVHALLGDREGVFRALRAEVDLRMREDTILVIGIDGELVLRRDAEKFFGDLNPLILLDWYHLATYLWEAAKILGGDDQDEWFERQSRRILEGNARRAVGGMRQSLRKRRIAGEARKTVEKTIQYISNHTRMLRYDQALLHGTPIATGAVEGACRYIVKDRLERSGMRWTHAGAQALLHHRCVFASNLTAEHGTWFREREQERLHGWFESMRKPGRTAA
jgi:hypothetical protein